MIGKPVKYLHGDRHNYSSEKLPVMSRKLKGRNKSNKKYPHGDIGKLLQMIIFSAADGNACLHRPLPPSLVQEMAAKAEPHIFFLPDRRRTAKKGGKDNGEITYSGP
nr:hypothetical protein [Evansella caseinilytica]